jgi:translocation and assembly module TamB
MRRLALAVFCAVVAATPVAAQDDDRGRLIRFLESQLSDGADRQVRIDGFRGALSSEAELDRLTISDADGEWLILENARLNWRRLALFSGALEVNWLTAERLVLLRPPLPPEGPDLPAPEATPFALPELPVSIDIGEITIDEVDIAEPVLGRAARLSVNGTAQLADGSGSADIRLVRLDGPDDTFILAAGFDNATRVLGIDVLLTEEAGGIVGDLLNIPGGPPLRLSVDGEGPLDDILVDIGLATDGLERVDGTVRSARAPDDTAQHIDIDLTGDLTPLMAPDYRPFFGDRSEVSARVELDDSGATRVRDLRLASAALLLDGDVFLDAQNRPALIDVAGRITPPNGRDRIVLPVPGGDTTLQAADLAIAFDAEAGESFVVDATLDDLRSADLSVRSAQVEADGRITPSATGVERVLAEVAVALQGVDHADPALAVALGQSVELATNVDWSATGTLQLSDLRLSAAGVALGGAVAADLNDGALPVDIDLSAELADLGRFSALSGQTLSGALEAGLAGTVDALSGAFDIVLTGTGRNLRVAPAVPDALLAGDTQLELAVSRDGEGVRIETLSLDGRQVSLDASGDLSSQGGSLTTTARLEDLGLLTNAVRGPANITAEIASASEGWQIDAALSGPGGLGAQADGLVGLEGGRVDVDVRGALPLALANRFISPQSINGQLNFDLGVRGEPGLDAVSGRLSASGARVVAPTLRLVLDQLALDASISGGRVSFDGSGAVSTGGRLGVSGTVDVAGPGVPGSIDVRLDAVRLVDPALYTLLLAQGALSVTGPLAVAPRVAGRIDLGESELRVPETGLGSAPAIPEITHVGESAAERRTRAAAGLLRSRNGSGGSGAVGLDLQINAPGRIFLRGRGIDAEFGGAIRIAGSSAAVIPSGQFDLIRGRISILGTRLDLTEGSATLQGDFDPFLSLRAESRAGGYRIIISVEGPASAPDISLSSEPFLPEDEVLAQLLFGRSVSSLSPVQLLQLADAASSLAGGSTNGGILSNLREGLGLDDLDLQTDDEGNAAVRAGRYLSDNVYTDVTIGAEGESELSLNIDLTPDITARGSFSSDGGSGIGVFFERDY